MGAWLGTMLRYCCDRNGRNDRDHDHDNVATATTTTSSVRDRPPVAVAPVPPVAAPPVAAPPAQVATAVRQDIRTYVAQWHAANKDNVNIGLVHVPLVGDVDVFPDRIERAVYEQMLTLLVTNLMEIEIKVAGVPMRLQKVVGSSLPDPPLDDPPKTS